MIGILAAIGTEIVKGLAGGIAQEVGGQAAGWALSKIFGGDSGETEAIQQLSDQLTQVANEVAQMDEEMQEWFGIIQEELIAIQQQQLYIAWQIRDNDLQGYITTLNVMYDRFISYTNNPATTSKDQISNLVDDILDTNDGAAVIIAQISNILVGSGSDKGALQLYTEMSETLVANGKQSCYKTIDDYFNYYINAAYAQQTALYLLIEAFHQQNNDPLAQQQRILYRNYVKSQEIPFVANVEKILRQQLAVLHKGSSIYDSNGFSWTTVNALQDYSGQAYYNSYDYYKPTSVRNIAEQILLYSLCLEKGSNRIVVYMIWPTLSTDGMLYGNKEFDDIPIFIKNNETEEEITTSYSDVVQTIAKDQEEHTYDCYNTEHKFKRIVYQDVPYGTYTLKDINNTPGLEPVDGSNQSINYFQDPMYLSYKMTINSFVQGSFMDFSVYADTMKYVAWW